MTSEDMARQCADDDTLLQLCKGLIEPNEKDRIMEHASGCRMCIERIAEIKKALSLDIPRSDVPKSLESSTIKAVSKQIKKGRRSDTLWKKHHIWLALFVIFVLLSFGLKSFFIQMLVLAIFFGIKWLLATRAHEMNIRVTHEQKNPDDNQENDRTRNYHTDRGRSLYHNEP